MTSNNRFDPALRAHVFHRQFPEGEERDAQPGAPPPVQETVAPRSADFASELEAALMRDLNTLSAGLRPKKLLPDRPSTQSPAIPKLPAAEAKPTSRDAPPPRIAAATPAAEAAPAVSPYAPPPKLPPATWPAAGAKAPPGEPKQASEKPPSPYAPQARRPAPGPAPAPLPTAAGRAKPADPAPAMRPAKPADPADPAGATALPNPVTRYAPPKRPAYPGAASRQIGVIAAPPAPPAPATETQVVAARQPSPGPDAAAAATAAIDRREAAAPPILPLTDHEAEAESEAFDGPSATELARLYAPQPPAAATVAPAVRPEPRAATPKDASPYAPPRPPLPGTRVTAPAGVDTGDTVPLERGPRRARRSGAARAGDSPKPRPIRWQASDETPAGVLRPRRGLTWISKAAVAFVLVGLIGGAGAVVTFEALTPAEPGPGAAAERTPPHGGSEADEAARQNPPLRNLPIAAQVLPRGVEVVHADDGDNGLAPAEGAPLPSSARVIPLPQPVPTGVGFRPTKDAASSRDAGDLGATETSDARAARPADVAPAAAEPAGEEPPTDAVDVTADGGDVAAGPAPRSPTPRPVHDGAAASGVLAYAPTADPVDRGAKAFAGRGEDKSAAKPPKSGPARVVSWVNMRAGADNKAATVTVLRAGSVVTVIQCSYWCEIVADGRRGFVFKSFLKSTGAMASGQ